jgi:hypothetical protein
VASNTVHFSRYNSYAIRFSAWPKKPNATLKIYKTSIDDFLEAARGSTSPSSIGASNGTCIQVLELSGSSARFIRHKTNKSHEKNDAHVVELVPIQFIFRSAFAGRAFSLRHERDSDGNTQEGNTEHKHILCAGVVEVFVQECRPHHSRTRKQAVVGRYNLWPFSKRAAASVTRKRT